MHELGAADSAADKLMADTLMADKAAADKAAADKIAADKAAADKAAADKAAADKAAADHAYEAKTSWALTKKDIASGKLQVKDVVEDAKGDKRLTVEQLQDIEKKREALIKHAYEVKQLPSGPAKEDAKVKTLEDAALLEQQGQTAEQKLKWDGEKVTVAQNAAITAGELTHKDVVVELEGAQATAMRKLDAINIAKSQQIKRAQKVAKMAPGESKDADAQQIIIDAQSLQQQEKAAKAQLQEVTKSVTTAEDAAIDAGALPMS